MNKLSFRYLVRTYAWPLRKFIFLLVIITLSSNFVTAIEPVVFAGVMNIIVGQNEISTAQKSDKPLDLNHIGERVLSKISEYSHNKWNSLLILVTIFIILVIVSSILSYIAYLSSLNIETKAQKLIQIDIMKHMFSLNMDFFNHQKTGDLMSRVIQDAKNTANGIGPLVRSLFHNTILIMIYAGYLFSTNMLLTVIALVLILVQFGLTEVVRRPIGKTVQKQLDETADFSNVLHEIFTSIRVMKTFGGERYELSKIEQGINKVNKSIITAGLVKHLQEPVRSTLDAFAIVGIVLVAAYQLMSGVLSIQGFALFIFVGQLLVTPINKLAVDVAWIQALVMSYARINEIIQTKPKVIDGDIIKKDFDKVIDIKNVSFSYGKSMVLENVSFEIKKGEIVAIVGPSGAGKSTLVDLILRFYNPTKGDIHIDDINLKEIKYDEYRHIFGVVPQQNILFNDTVRNNILYGRLYLNDDDAVRAAQIANAHDFIMELPHGYDTFVGERGVLLSGGQCQRIAIARAVVAKPPILILDEATSSLDSESERQVQMAIDRVLESATAIVIAHRLSTILHAHKIIVLQKGRIEAIGTHSELLLKSPTYKLLYNLQFRNLKLNGDVDLSEDTKD